MIYVLALLGTVACTSENEIEEIAKSNNDPVEIKFGSSVLNLETKAINATDKFTDGDKIGVCGWEYTGETAPTPGTSTIYSDLNNAIYTSDANGNLTCAATPLYPLDGTKLDLYAYHPRVETLTSNKASYTLANQNDIMWATPLKGMSKSSANAAFSFSHKLAAISVVIKTATGITETLNVSKITLGGYAENATLDITDGTIAVVGDAKDVDLSITPKDLTSADQTFVTDYLVWPGIQPSFKITINNTSYDVTGISTAAAVNKKTTYTITVSGKGVAATATITGWDSNPVKDDNGTIN